MNHQHQKKPFFLLVWFVLFSCSSKASSFGTATSFTRNSSYSTSSGRMMISRYHNKHSINARSAMIGSGSSLSKSLLTRGGSDDVPVEIPVEGDSTSVSTSSTTALSATANDNDSAPVQTPTQTSSSISTSSSSASPASSQMGPNATPPGFLRKLFPTIPWHTLPNLLTYARCIAIPGLILQFYLSTSPSKNIHSSLIFAIASITDYLDGYLARRWDICSPFGAFLDPVADKLMVSTALILLCGKYGMAVSVPTSIILAREIAVSALREWMASKGKRDSVKVGFQGKVKTAATMVALTIILCVPDGIGLKWNIQSLLQVATSSVWENVMSLGMVLLFISSFVTITSGSVYFKAAAPVLMGKE